MDERPVNNWWWVLPFVVLGLYYAHTRTTLALDGIIALVSGSAVALDVNGAADSLPTQLVRALGGPAEQRRGWKRTCFAFVALWGFAMLVVALDRPDLIHTLRT